MEVSENYTEDAYVMGIDLKGFFMSIYKPLLAKMVDDFIVRNYHGDDKEDLRWLCQYGGYAPSREGLREEERRLSLGVSA